MSCEYHLDLYGTTTDPNESKKYNKNNIPCKKGDTFTVNKGNEYEYSFNCPSNIDTNIGTKGKYSGQCSYRSNNLTTVSILLIIFGSILFISIIIGVIYRYKKR
jgi:hypothetical protein